MAFVTPKHISEVYAAAKRLNVGSAFGQVIKTHKGIPAPVKAMINTQLAKKEEGDDKSSPQQINSGEIAKEEKTEKILETEKSTEKVTEKVTFINHVVQKGVQKYPKSGQKMVKK